MKLETTSPVSAGPTPIAPSTERHTQYELWGKRAFDLALALFLLPILAPIIAVLLLLVRDRGAPAIFKHVRVGQNGRLFKCFKIRTMVPDAEAKLKGYLDQNPEAAAEWAKTQKLTNDPRVTPVGKFLRKTSLDELPQIWNVLRGDMSFVGPRPVTEPELERYGLSKRIYLRMKPGITGLWQVRGRSNGDYGERCRLDRIYSLRMGLGLDIALIAKTAGVVIHPTGR